MVVGVKRILDWKTLWFVQSKVTLAQWFCAEREPSDTTLLLLQTSADAGADARPSPPRLNASKVKSAHAIVGASAPQKNFADAGERFSAASEKFSAPEKILCRREAEGWRGVHPRI